MYVCIAPVRRSSASVTVKHSLTDSQLSPPTFARDALRTTLFAPLWCSRRHFAPTLIIIVLACNSLILVFALVENVVDLFVWSLLRYAGNQWDKKQRFAKYLSSSSRFKPVAITVAATVVVLTSFVFIYKAAEKSIHNFSSSESEPPHI